MHLCLAVAPAHLWRLMRWRQACRCRRASHASCWSGMRPVMKRCGGLSALGVVLCRSSVQHCVGQLLNVQLAAGSLCTFHLTAGSSCIMHAYRRMPLAVSPR